MDSLDSSLPQRIGSLGLNDYLFCRGLGPGGLCYKELMVDGVLFWWWIGHMR
jgi:hypothetical protein